MSCAAFLERIWRDSRGAAAAETVLVMPLAILMIFLALEAGFYLYTEHQVVNGVRDAARYAARLDMVSVWGCTGATNDTAYTGSQLAPIKNVARYGVATTTGTPVARPWTWDEAEVEVRYKCVSDAQYTGIYTDHSNGYAPVITVIGRPNYPSLFGTLAGFDTTLHLYAKQEAAGAGV